MAVLTYLKHCHVCPHPPLFQPGQTNLLNLTFNVFQATTMPCSLPTDFTHVFYPMTFLINDIYNSSMIQHYLLACCSPFPIAFPGTGAVSTLACETREGCGFATSDGSPLKIGENHILPHSAPCCCRQLALEPNA